MGSKRKGSVQSQSSTTSSLLFDSHSFGPLHKACLENNLKLAKRLVESDGEDVNSRSGINGYTPLHCASMSKDGREDVSLMQYLVGRGAKVNASCSSKQTALILSARNNDFDKIKFLLDLRKAADVNVQDYKGKSALYWATKAGNIKAMRLLIKQLGDINVKDDEGQTLLHVAAGRGDLKAVKLLIETGTKVNEKDSILQSPLHLAAGHGDPDLVRVLLQAGADVRATDGAKQTPLHWSARNDHDRASLELARAPGCNVNAKDCNGQTPLHVSMRYDCLRVIASLSKTGTLDVNVTDGAGQTPLHHAVSQGNHELADILIVLGARLDVRDSFGKTPLFLACENALARVATMLISAGAKDFGSDYLGRTALYFAAMSVPASGSRLKLLQGKEQAQKQFELAGWLGNYKAFRGLKKLYKEQVTTTQSLMYNLVSNKLNPESKGLMMRDLIGKTRTDIILSQVNGCTLLTNACKSGLVEIVDIILQNVWGKQLLNTGMPKPLWIASNEGNNRVLKILLRHSRLQDLNEAINRDGTSPLTLIIAKDNQEGLDLVKDLYSQEDILSELVQFGNMRMLQNVQIDKVRPKLLMKGIKSGKPDVVRHLLMHTKGSLTDLPVPTNSLRILEMFSKYPSQNLEESELTRISQKYPVFNPESVNLPKSLVRGKEELTLDDDIKPMILEEFCCLHNFDNLNKPHIGPPHCVKDCKQKTECRKIKDLLKALNLLISDLRRGTLKWLQPKLILVGSIMEGSSLRPVTDIDLTMTFATLQEEQPFQTVGSNACEIVLSDSSILAQKGFCKTNKLTERKIFHYEKFLKYLLDCIKDSLCRVTRQQNWPQDLKANTDWNLDLCGACQRISGMDRSSVYSPFKHCQTCLPAVTHTRIGPCLLFTWGRRGKPLIVDIAPTYPVASPGTGLLPLYRAVFDTLVDRKPDDWLDYLKKTLQTDRPLPDNYFGYDSTDQETVFGVSIKLLNHSPKLNHILRPGKANVRMEGRLRDVYSHAKAVNSILAQDHRISRQINSHSIKKVVSDGLGSEIESSKMLMDEALLLTLSHAEIRDAFDPVVDFAAWEAAVEERKKSRGNDVLTKIPLKK